MSWHCISALPDDIKTWPEIRFKVSYTWESRIFVHPKLNFACLLISGVLQCRFKDRQPTCLTCKEFSTEARPSWRTNNSKTSQWVLAWIWQHHFSARSEFLTRYVLERAHSTLYWRSFNEFYRYLQSVQRSVYRFLFLLELLLLPNVGPILD